MKSSNHDEKVKSIARAEGIALTPKGEPLFARDLPRWREIRAIDTRTPEQRAVDESIDRASQRDD